MAAKIGILGEAIGTSVATVTIYTVPADKAARVRILFAVDNSTNAAHYSVQIGTPGSEYQLHAPLASGIDFFTGTTAQSSPDPDASMKISDGGLIVQNIGDVFADDNGYRYAIYPFPMDYYLSTGDTVKYMVVTNAIGDHLIQVVGVEDDA